MLDYVFLPANEIDGFDNAELPILRSMVGGQLVPASELLSKIISVYSSLDKSFLKCDDVFRTAFRDEVKLREYLDFHFYRGLTVKIRNCGSCFDTRASVVSNLAILEIKLNALVALVKMDLVSDRDMLMSIVDIISDGNIASLFSGSELFSEESNLLRRKCNFLIGYLQGNIVGLYQRNNKK